MREVRRTAIVPHTPAQMFDLVADCESYPDFVPGCVDATLVERSATDLTGRLVLAEGPVRIHVTTYNRFDRPHWMTLELVDGPLSELHGEWRFEPLGESGCRVNLEMRFAVAGRVKDRLLGPVIERTASRLVDVFVRRAGQVYGGG